jgi:antitoxin (DNA-binding transcriptional repressor) of toxin-antitoxin stability system
LSSPAGGRLVTERRYVVDELPFLSHRLHWPMAEVAVREHRNDGGRVLERVERGESLTVTRDGHAIAELRPLSRRPLRASALLAQWRRLAQVDPARGVLDTGTSRLATSRVNSSHIS